MKIRRGQALVEFSLVMGFFIILLWGISDIAPLLTNVYKAQQATAGGARAGSIYYADGSRTCLGDVMDAINNPNFLSAEWTVDVSPNCTNVPTDTLASGEDVTVTIGVTYTPPFIGGIGWPPKETADIVWTITTVTTEKAR